jgi:hypothetical protein
LIQPMAVLGKSVGIAFAMPVVSKKRSLRINVP